MMCKLYDPKASQPEVHSLIIYNLLLILNHLPAQPLLCCQDPTDPRASHTSHHFGPLTAARFVCVRLRARPSPATRL